MPRPSRAVAALALVLVVSALALVAWNRCFFLGCPDVDRLTSYRPGGAPVLLDRNGKAFGDLAPVEGELVRLASLPKFVPEAFIAIEDQRFRQHGAIDVRRVFGALWRNVRARGVEEGSSTLTMQLARNVFPERLPGQQRTMTRKLLEVRVAQEIEQRFSKDEILELYLNHIYFGNGARGIEAASRLYFSRPASRLTLAQAALLAALPKAPSHYDPRRHPKAARERRDLVLRQMATQGKITKEEAEAARQAPMGVARRARGRSAPRPFAGYFVEEVRRDLEDRFGEDLYGERLRVHTTLDPVAQSAAEQELDRQLRAVEAGAAGAFSGPRYAPGAPDDDTPYLQGAVVALEAATGDVLAWVGGRDVHDSRFDRVRGARRQAGSAFKPFVYAAAVAAGHPLSETVSDAPLRVSLGNGESWAPRNFDGGFEGSITLRDALVRSKNVATVRLAAEVGTHRVAELAQQAGIAPPIPEEPSMALGTVAVSPLELAAAYTPFASLGPAAAPRVVTRVEREDGTLLYEAEPPARRAVLDAGVAYVVTDALRDVLLRGTGREVAASGLQAPAAGKTGTTNDGADAWFVGFTPEITAAVWIGFDQRRPIVPRATGGKLAAPVWARMMRRVYAGRPLPAPWPRPPNVIEGMVDPATGQLLQAGCRPLLGPPRREVFLRGSQPAAGCPASGEEPPMDLAASMGEWPDYEEGLETGLPPDAVSPAPEEDAEAGPLPRVVASPGTAPVSGTSGPSPAGPPDRVSPRPSPSIPSPAPPPAAPARPAATAAPSEDAPPEEASPAPAPTPSPLSGPLAAAPGRAS